MIFFVTKYKYPFMKYSLYLLLLCPLLFACQNGEQAESGQDHSPSGQPTAHSHSHHGEANSHMNQRPFEDLVEGFESPERAEWQKPDSVIALLGDLEGKTVVDIGSGTGYFSFRLAKAGARVISADVDERFLEYIEERKEKEGMTGAQIQTRHLAYDSPKLEEGEVDLAFMVNVYHHIEQRPEYFSKVKKGLKPGGRLVVVDFIKSETPVGPPVEMKLEPEQVVEELKEAGFTEFEVNEELLPYQYVVTAW